MLLLNTNRKPFHCGTEEQQTKQKQASKHPRPRCPLPFIPDGGDCISSEERSSTSKSGLMISKGRVEVQEIGVLAILATSDRGKRKGSHTVMNNEDQASVLQSPSMSMTRIPEQGRALLINSLLHMLQQYSLCACPLYSNDFLT